MNFIQNIPELHTVAGALGSACFVALAMRIPRYWRTGARPSCRLSVATTLPAILGTVGAYLQLQEARSLMAAVEGTAFAPDAAVRTIFWLLGTGIASSAILLALCAMLFSRTKNDPEGSEEPVGSFSAVQGLA